MPGILLKPVDLVSLAARETGVRETISLNELPRLVEALQSSRGNHGAVECELRASQEHADQLTLRGSLKTRWRLCCQRCLGEMDYDVDISFMWVFQRDEGSPFVLSDEPVRLADYVEDELLLEMPQIPMHADTAECGSLVRRYKAAPEQNEASVTRTPFAGLRELMDGEDD